MLCYNNRSLTLRSYAEIILTPAHCYDRSTGRRFVGYSVSAHVYSGDPKYDALIDLRRHFVTQEEGAAFLRQEAAKYGLLLDKSMAHRNRMFAVPA